MAFIDNPTISTLGAALGLGPLFSAASGDPTSPTAVAPPQVKPGASKPNIPEYKSRPYAPRIETPLHGAGGVAPGGGNPSAPGTMDPATLQDPNVQSLLGRYGVQAPDSPPDPNLFIHNQQAFQNHPLVSGLLERGLEGLAYSHPGQNFFQSLVGGTRGIQEANATRASQVNAQTMAPIQQAQMIQSLQGNAQKADDEHAKAQSEMAYQHGLISHYVASDATKSARIAAVPPRFGKDGQPYYYSEDDDGKPSWEPDKSWTPDPRTALVKKAYDNQMKSWQSKYKDISDVPPGEIMNFLTGMESQESMAKGAAGIHNTNTKAAATVQAAGIRATSNGTKMSAQDRLRYNDLNTQDKTIQREIDNASRMGAPLVDMETGALLSTTNSKKAYAQRMSAKQNAIRLQKSQLLGTPAPAAQPSIPEGADGVWDPATKTTIYRNK